MRTWLRAWIIFAAFWIVSVASCFSQGPDSTDSDVSSRETTLGPIIIMEMELVTFPDGGRMWAADSLALKQAATGNVTNMLEVLPSVNLKSYAPGGLATPTFRGTGAGHTQAYWEGLPLNSAMLGQQDFALAAGSFFEKMNVIYGGSSLLLGSGGLGGAINLSSDQNFNWPYRQEVRLRQQVGSWGNTSSVAEGEFRSEKFASSTKAYFNAGRNDMPFRNVALPGSPVQRLPQAGTQQYGILQEFCFPCYTAMKLKAKVWAFRSARELPPTMLTTASDETQMDEAIRASLAWETRFQDHTLKVQGGYFREGMRYSYPSAGLLSESQTTRFTTQASLDRNYYSRLARWFREVGLRYIHDRATTDGYAHGVTQNIVSAAARARVPFDSRAQYGRGYVGGLLRLELYDTRLAPFMAYIGTNYRFSSRLSINAQLTRNARIPTLNDRFWSPGGNPDLRPELSHGAEMSLSWKNVRYSLNRPKVRGDLGGFFNRVNDWILWVPGTGNIWRPENVRLVNAWGIEANYTRNAQINDHMGYQVLASYTFNQSRDQDGYQLIYTPAHSAFMRLHLDYRRWSFQYFQDWNSRRYTVADNSAYIRGFSTGDLSLGARVNRWRHDVTETPDPAGVNGYRYASLSRRHVLELQAGVRNLWNAQYQTVAWRPMPGRSVFVRLDWTFSNGTEK